MGDDRECVVCEGKTDNPKYELCWGCQQDWNMEYKNGSSPHKWAASRAREALKLELRVIVQKHSIDGSNPDCEGMTEMISYNDQPVKDECLGDTRVLSCVNNDDLEATSL